MEGETKYSERVMDRSKLAISLMYARCEDILYSLLMCVTKLHTSMNLEQQVVHRMLVLIEMHTDGLT